MQMHFKYLVTFTTYWVHDVVYEIIMNILIMMTMTCLCLTLYFLYTHPLSLVFITFLIFSLQVVLERGDVLFVPRHWWHCVECIEPAVSVNTWIEVVRISQYMYQTFKCIGNLLLRSLKMPEKG